MTGDAVPDLSMCGVVGESVGKPDWQAWSDRDCPHCYVRKRWQAELNPLPVRYPDEHFWRGWQLIAEPSPRPGRAGIPPACSPGVPTLASRCLAGVVPCRG